jgi:protein-S-isoprenylcysteine O-methyltransferase Ste14
MVSRGFVESVPMTNPANPFDPDFARPSAVPWPPILLAFVVVSAIALGRMMPLTWPGVDDRAAQIVGIGLGGAGLLLVAWAVVTLLRHKTTVMPDQPASHLVTTGPFALRRNPIYLGEILMLFGIAELTKNIWFVAMAIAFGMLVTWLAILPEERHLEARFGDAWRDYASRTRRLI